MPLVSINFFKNKEPRLDPRKVLTIINNSRKLQSPSGLGIPTLTSSRNTPFRSFTSRVELNPPGQFPFSASDSEGDIIVEGVGGDSGESEGRTALRGDRGVVW